MNKRGWIGFIVIAVFVIAFMGFLILRAAPKTSYYSEDGSGNSGEEDFYCVSDSECIDEDKCTLHSCQGGKCVSTDVVLCYQNDGCCPNGCTPENDNDC